MSQAVWQLIIWFSIVAAQLWHWVTAIKALQATHALVHRTDPTPAAVLPNSEYIYPFAFFLVWIVVFPFAWLFSALVFFSS